MIAVVVVVVVVVVIMMIRELGMSFFSRLRPGYLSRSDLLLAGPSGVRMLVGRHFPHQFRPHM